jgi:hypothetical protein
MNNRRAATALAIGVVVAGMIPAMVSEASSPPSSDGSDTAYCDAHLALEEAASGDGSAMGAAVAEAMAAAPDELQEPLATAVASAPNEGPSSPEFDEAYGTIVQWLRGHCGFNELNVLAKDYSYGGIGGEVAAGPTILTIDNQGTEFHEMAIIRKNDGVTETAEELLALPDEEVDAKITFVGAAVSPPGAEGYGVVDLTPGDYIGLCFFPEGSTPEAMAEMMAAEASMPEGSAPAGSEGDGEEGTPHAFLGMIVEFTVVEGGTTDTGSMMPMDHSTDMTDMTDTTESA